MVALVGWSAVMWIAERVGKRDRPESSLNLKDAVIIGLVQCVALIPGVSRSGATISPACCGIWTGSRQRGWRHGDAG